MNEFIKKLIERLEEKALEHAINGQQFSADGWDNHASEEYNKCKGLDESIKIVSQVAEEYATDINVGNKDSAKVNQEPKTRIECLRSMSVEELADKILSFDELSISLDFCQNFSECEKKWDEGDAIPDEMCKKCLVKWLNSPEGQKEEILADYFTERFGRVL